MNSQILAKINGFVKNRLIELMGATLALISIFLLISILSYSPSDPNFIYNPENVEINNFAGFYGSVVADFFLQAIGLVSFFVIVNLFIWGIKILTKKKINNFITKPFFTIIYIVFGTIFISIFSNDSFWLIDNGNGGFAGNLLKEKILLIPVLQENLYFSYFFLLISIIFFILSLDLKLNEILRILNFPFFIIKKLIELFNKRGTENNYKSTNLDADTKEIKETLVEDKQPILPFSIRPKKKEVKKYDSHFKLPPVNFLEKNLDTKNKKNIDNDELRRNSEFLEKILLDFGVEGKIKRVSYGPVVTLNEFEPASGIKVSKIVNLSDDIARNTSSTSARVATT